MHLHSQVHALGVSVQMFTATLVTVADEHVGDCSINAAECHTTLKMASTSTGMLFKTAHCQTKSLHESEKASYSIVSLQWLRTDRRNTF